jgi:LysR family transcriptional regulator, hydrogen peroxide-inducible genes activator
MTISLKQLRYFAALAEHGHFGRAAQACHVSQPVLSVQIRELERALGVSLAERGGREVVLTAAGREIARRARRVLDEVREIEQAARWSQGLAGRLSLGVIPTVAPYLLPAALPLMKARDLSLDLGVREATTGRLVEELKQGRLDAAVVALPLGDPALAETPLFEDRFLLAGSADRVRALAGATERLRPDGIRAQQLLLLDEGHCLADQALEVCALDRSRTVDLGASSLATLARLAAEGFGVTLLPEIAALTERASAPGLALMRFADPQPLRTVGLVRRAGTADDGWFADLAELLSEAGRRLPRPDGLE